jgi:hypothetical protein
MALGLDRRGGCAATSHVGPPKARSGSHLEPCLAPLVLQRASQWPQLAPWASFASRRHLGANDPNEPLWLWMVPPVQGKERAGEHLPPALFVREPQRLLCGRWCSPGTYRRNISRPCSRLLLGATAVRPNGRSSFTACSALSQLAMPAPSLVFNKPHLRPQWKSKIDQGPLDTQFWCSQII